MADDLEKAVAAAVERERASGDKHFVYVRRESCHLPGLRARLEVEARESGRMLVQEPDETPAARLARENAARMADAPTVARSNHRGFLDNLAGIAAGRVKVTK